ncbi:YibE/F family protein [Natroniella sulfidigena]|uniref:YibE/F family protein n=1 Tax=Natroniella sulfidigena TaxID=723921 RepID=UPI00200B2619|nr:YibE/F family protein [Natroniella sulfidigena]MCK8816830.1 YibE/F family protein [Natroniella sulfidigena]
MNQKLKVIMLILIMVIVGTTTIMAEEVVFNGSEQQITPPEEVDQQPQEQVEQGAEQGEVYYRGRVVLVQDVETDDEFSTEEQINQRARVVITTGPHQDEVIDVDNTYQEGHYYYNLYLEEDMEVILVAMEEDSLEGIYLYDLARDKSLLYLAVIFIVCLLVIGKFKGLKTLITLFLAGVTIVYFMLPLMLAGHNPITVGVASAIIILIPTFLLVSGFNFKSLAAMAGTSVGVVVAGFLALWIGRLANLTGFSSQEAQMLMVMDQSINIQGLLFAGIIIGSLGAVTDVSMSVASSMAEIKRNNPQIEQVELIKSGMNVGRDIMGTMANTLLLAYVGGVIPLLLLLMGTEMPWIRIINLDLIATEVVRGLTGSIGLVISIPVTALITGVLLKKYRD